LGQLHYLSAFTEVGVSDLDASVRWYEEKLGFHRMATYGDAVHMRRAEGQDVLLRPGGGGVTLQMATDLDLAQLGGERSAEEPGTIELHDPDGNALRVYARERPGPVFRPGRA
jgi:catechol 2,3-dioxygenase-like lactoylglutathione lyase family enzyme